MMLRGQHYPAFVAPLPVHFDGVPIWSRAKLLEKAANSRMRRFRAVPVCRRAWYVTLTALELNESHFKPGQLVSGCAFEPQQFWVRAKRVADKWVRLDCAAGGCGSAFPVEMRLCAVCGKTLLGAQAFAYRQKQRWPRKKWQFKQGPMCGPDCDGAHRNSKLKETQANE